MGILLPIYEIYDVHACSYCCSICDPPVAVNSCSGWRVSETCGGDSSAVGLRYLQHSLPPVAVEDFRRATRAYTGCMQFSLSFMPGVRYSEISWIFPVCGVPSRRFCCRFSICLHSLVCENKCRVFVSMSGMLPHDITIVCKGFKRRESHQRVSVDTVDEYNTNGEIEDHNSFFSRRGGEKHRAAPRSTIIGIRWFPAIMYIMFIVCPQGDTRHVLR